MKDINLITAGLSVCDAGKIGSFLYAGCPIWVADNESEEKELIKIESRRQFCADNWIRWRKYGGSGLKGKFFGCL